MYRAGGQWHHLTEISESEVETGTGDPKTLQPANAELWVDTGTTPITLTAGSTAAGRSPVARQSLPAPQEVEIGPAAPREITVELWYDTTNSPHRRGRCAPTTTESGRTSAAPRCVGVGTTDAVRRWAQHVHGRVVVRHRARHPRRPLRTGSRSAPRTSAGRRSSQIGGGGCRLRDRLRPGASGGHPERGELAPTTSHGTPPGEVFVGERRPGHREDRAAVTRCGTTRASPEQEGPSSWVGLKVKVNGQWEEGRPARAPGAAPDEGSIIRRAASGRGHRTVVRPVPPSRRIGGADEVFVGPDEPTGVPRRRTVVRHRRHLPGAAMSARSTWGAANLGTT